jgi:TolB-like protein/DNA-binding winged helix-turn-helix (wHTH) protein/Flp pilus assembly protein TadD
MYSARLPRGHARLRPPSGRRMEPSRHASVVRFGTYELGLQSGELRKAGARIRVQQQPLKLLEILLERPGEVVTRDELRNRIWPEESYGDFDQAVNVAIAKLRAALGDSADNPRYVETLPRRGYRFIADVSVVAPPAENADLSLATKDHAGQEVASSSTNSKGILRRHAWGFLGLSITLLPVLAWVSWSFLRSGKALYTVSSTPIHSLAVLPLENLSSDSEDYFADGMTDELITDLAQISALRVISRTSIMPYKGIRRPLSQIAHELGVDAVVEGTVLRSGKQVRITAQLIRAPDDNHLWAQSYEGDVRDTLALQKRVARTIAEQIRIKLTPRDSAVLESMPKVSPEAYDNYIKGRYFWNKRTAGDAKKAISYFNKAIAIDPNYSLPHSGLAEIYQISDRPQLAREEVQKALKLDDQSAEAHNSLANLLSLFDRDWEGASREFKRALELDHNYAPAHHWYSMFLALEGRKTEALAEAQKAYELDPLSPVVGANLAKILQESGQDDKALDQAKRTLDLEPDSAITHAVLGLVYENKRMYEQAITEYRTAVRAGDLPEETRGLLGHAYAISGNRTEAEKIIADLKTLWPTHPRAALDLAVVYSGLGDKDSAMSWLQQARDKNVRDIAGVSTDPHFAELRNDRRFQELVRQVGAPQQQQD